MQTERICPNCQSTAARLRASDRHRGYYTCWACDTDYEVDIYA
jgi:hypothetical protein